MFNKLFVYPFIYLFIFLPVRTWFLLWYSTWFKILINLKSVGRNLCVDDLKTNPSLQRPTWSLPSSFSGFGPRSPLCPTPHFLFPFLGVLSVCSPDFPFRTLFRGHPRPGPRTFSLDRSPDKLQQRTRLGTIFIRGHRFRVSF